MTLFSADSSFHLLRRLLREYVSPYYPKLALATLAMILVAATTATNAWMMQPVLDKIFLQKDASMLVYIPIAVLAIALVKGTAAFFQNVLMKSVGQRVVTDMQLTLYAHLLYSDMALLHNHSSGRLISRFTNDITIMRGAVSNVLTGIAREFLTVIFLISLMIYQSGLLAVIALIIFPLAFYPIIRLGKRMRKIANKTQEELGNYTSQLDETFQGIRVVKAYLREGFEISRARHIIEGIFSLYIKAARTESATSPLMESLSGIAIAAVIWYGGMQVIEGTTTPGSFFSFIAAFIMAYKPIKSLADLNTSLQEGLAAAKRLFAILDITPTIRDTTNSTDLVLQGGKIVFDRVTFHYTPGKAALNHISFTVPAGKTVALVGASGSGKSTVMNLLLRFYDPNHGTITIDGCALPGITLTSLREAISLVSQDIVLFDDTVIANIRYGKLEATEEEVIEAAKKAAAHEFIMQLPEGYHTRIGQRGFSLSGGQRQRLSIARAMLKDSPILLLDEATSALDPISEQLIQLALEKLKEGRTTLVIAHRLSTVQDADVIHVLKDGQVMESGTHTELLTKNGEYSNLYSRGTELTPS